MSEFVYVYVKFVHDMGYYTVGSWHFIWLLMQETDYVYQRHMFTNVAIVYWKAITNGNIHPVHCSNTRVGFTSIAPHHTDS